jgi:uncharacterized protein YlxW (UPF0749 family)
MSGRGAQWAIGIVMLILGFLAIVQLRAQQGGTGLENLTAQDLTALIANVNQRNDELQAEVVTLESQLRDLQAANAQGESSLGDLRTDLRRVRLWAGLDPVRGRGVVIQCSGPVEAHAVADLLNDLRAAGAEALAIEGVRIVQGTVVAGPPGRLSAENVALPPTFTILAIGNPVNLTASLTRVGGVIGQIQVATPDVVIDVTPSDAIVLPATTRSLVPGDARPHI